jgi:hypothetical protein
MSFGDFCAHPHLLRPLLGPTYANSIIVFKAADAEEWKTEEERAFYEQLTGVPWPEARVMERFLNWGRRLGKSIMSAAYAVYTATMIDFTGDLAAGEYAEIAILSPTALQASKLFDYVCGFFDAVPLLGALIKRRTSDTIELTNMCRISVRVANPRTIRGITSPLIILDETAFFQSADTGACNDREIVNACRPCLATLNGILLSITSPYARDGYVYSVWESYQGRDGVAPDPSVLTFMAASKTFNPTIPQRVIDRAIADDPEAAKSEWLGQWRDPLSKLFGRDLVMSRVMKDVERIQPTTEIMKAFYDASGGVGDSAALAIAYARPDGVATLMLLHEIKAPHNPIEAIAECAAILKGYGIYNVQGDKYSIGFVGDNWNNHGVSYEFSEQTKSQIYVSSIPLMTSGKLALLHNKTLVDQLCSLERKTGRNTGVDQVDHPATAQAKDDCANAAMGALLLVAEVRKGQEIWEHMAEGAENFLNHMKLHYGFPAGF